MKNFEVIVSLLALLAALAALASRFRLPYLVLLVGSGLIGMLPGTDNSLNIS